ncbi:MAG: hypothetical protein H6Q76_844 [Firmicutes bacterium]|nr:hypothetical protein [Bacillota bacterium]
MIYAIKFFYMWVLPPAGFVLLLAWLAWRLWRKSRGLSGMAWLIAALLYTVSIQPVSEALLRPLEYRHPLPLQAEGDSIILLGGGSMADVPTPEGWRGQVADVPAQRIIGAYALHRRTGWPIVVSGGEVFRGDGKESVVMQDILVGLGMEPGLIILEDRSLNTTENAIFSSEILKQRNLSRPILVTSAFHMARSVEEFKKTGVTVTPYPVGYFVSRRSYWNALSWVPTFSAMRGTGLALKEYMGLVALNIRR